MPTTNPGLHWIKASSSVGTGACVELARDGDMIALRDSKNPDTAPLRYTAREISAFLHGAKSGEFDHLVELPAEPGAGRTAIPGA